MGNLCSVALTPEDFYRCWNCIARQASYTCKLEKNLDALGVELDTLKARRDDVDWRVALAERQRMTRLNEVQLWLTRVQTAEAGAEALIEDRPQQLQKLCFAGCFSKNCKSSYNFGKQVTKKLKEIVDLKDAGVFETVAENELVAQVDVRPAENELAAQADVRPAGSTVGLKRTFDKVWHLLEQNDVGSIGLHGLGGVGKTTLLTQINNKLSSEGYAVVIWVVVSKDHNIETVQEKIGQKLSLTNAETWKNKSFDLKAVDIWEVLSKKKFVLLLDDVWERVNLIKVGIPNLDQKNGSKLIFTTRSLDVCGEMEAGKVIKVECLSEHEAWKLFEEKVGEETLDSHPEIRGLAKQVAAKCGGLPLALITIGRAMANKKMPELWEYAIKVLIDFPHKLKNMDKEVYAVLKFSYDSLPNDMMRSCFLYCSLYSEDFEIPIDKLKDYWFYEGFLNEFDNIIDARMQGGDVINSLLSACLLERCKDSTKCVKMHDVIRDMALWIARECEAPEKRFFVRTSTKAPDVEKLENWEGVRMSLMKSPIKELQGPPRCPNLQTLFLNGNGLEVISDGFFQFMRNLRVLNLSSNYGFSKLPQGISELVSLEFLDLQRTKIIELPSQLSKLSKLKYLDLRESMRLIKIPRELICKFSMMQTFKFFPFVPGWDNVDSLIEELKCLQHLNVLWIEISSDFALESFLSCHKLRGCTEGLSLHSLRETKALSALSLADMERLEILRIAECDIIQMVARNIEKESRERRMIQTSSLFPTNSNTITPRFHALSKIEIYYCPKLRNLTWLIFAPNLTELLVIDCPKMEEIISEVSEVANVVGILNPSLFAKLERLILYGLYELKSIYWDALSFPCLRKIMVKKCPKLKKLPLNCDSAKGNQIRIEGSEKWWKEVQWKDEVTRSTFSDSFQEPGWTEVDDYRCFRHLILKTTEERD